MNRSLQTFLLDACCLLNLYAFGYLRAIITNLPFGFGITHYVATNDMLFLGKLSETGDEELSEPVDIRPLIKDDILRVFRLEHSVERTKYIDFAALMDDGKAETGAIAFHLGFAVPTDDRKARRILGEAALSIKLVSTLQLIKQWVVVSSAPNPKLQRALYLMKMGSSWFPGKRDPQFSLSMRPHAQTT